ncbi:MAG: YdcF family protein [Bacteroidales bacterium]
MPGKSGLIRSYYAYRASEHFPNSKVIISLPGETDDEFSSVNLMKKELALRGISEERIYLEPEGKNTRDQVLEIKKMVSVSNLPLLIVTSPEHMRRAIMAFEKAGFSKIGGLPAFDNANEADLFFDDKDLGEKNRFLPDIGENIQIRYQFWKHLNMKYYL